MLNFDNFELDFDDGFSTSIFSKCLQPESRKQKEEEEKNMKTQNLNISDVIFGDSEEKVKNGCWGNDDIFEEFHTGTLSSNTFLNDFLSEEHKRGGNKEVTSLKRTYVEEGQQQKKRISHGRLLERKFPGPAGLLPDRPYANDLKDLSMGMEKSEEENKEAMKREAFVYSQSSGSAFLEPTYQRLVSDFELNEVSNPLARYTVDWVKRSATKKALHGRKIPFLAVVLHRVDHGTLDPVLVLRDPTGEICGTLHREVWTNLGGKLRAGITLALRQVGVLITGIARRQIYINITLNNILALYCCSESGDEVEVRTVNKISKEDLMRNLEAGQRKPENKSTVAMEKESSSLFTTIADESSDFRKRGSMENIKSRVLGEGGWEGMQKTTEETGKEFLENVRILLDNGDFSDVMDLPEAANEVENSELKNKEGGREHLKVDQRVEAKGGEKGGGFFKPETRREDSEVNPKSGNSILSQEESLILEEVFSGVDLNDFEL